MLIQGLGEASDVGSSGVQCTSPGSHHSTATIGGSCAPCKTQRFVIDCTTGENATENLKWSSILLFRRQHLPFALLLLQLLSRE